MKNREDISVYLTGVAETLKQEAIVNLDFDALQEALRESVALLGREEGLRQELALLRDDLVARTAGMLKGVVAVGRNQSRSSETLIEIESLSLLSAADLITAYRKAAARYRDAFPASFRNLAPYHGRRPSRELSDYK